MEKIKGLNKLSEEQKELMYRVNENHTSCVGNAYKDGMEIIETWIENGCVCVRLKNGDWYHYSDNGAWY